MKRYIYIFLTIALGLAAAGALAQMGGGGFSGPGATLRGPTSSTDNAIVRFDGTTGKRVQNSGVVINDDDAMTNASQPCFLAFNSATDTNVTGTGTIFTLDLDTEVFDQGNDFAADTFTAPVTGRYTFATEVRYIGLLAGADFISVAIVTSNRTYDRFISAPDNLPGEAAQGLAVAAADMDLGDTAVVEVFVNGEASDVVDIRGDATILLTYFSGCLIS